jgi:hypothetical protein
MVCNHLNNDKFEKLSLMPKSQQGYDIIAYPILYGSNIKLQCYISVKLGLSGDVNDSYETRYDKTIISHAKLFIQTMEGHFNKEPNDNNTSIDDDMSSLYFILYTWELDNQGDDYTKSKYELLKQLWLDHIKLHIIHRREMNNTYNSNSNKNDIYDKIDEYIINHYNENVFLVTKSQMKDWLVPSMVPFGDLFSSIAQPDDDDDY